MAAITMDVPDAFSANGLLVGESTTLDTSWMNKAVTTGVSH